MTVASYSVLLVKHRGISHSKRSTLERVHFELRTRRARALERIVPEEHRTLASSVESSREQY